MKLSSFIPTSRTQGFVLPLTLLICSIILSVATAISVILVKELYFSQLSRESQRAYYAADNGLECAIVVDDTYVDSTTGIGIFEYGGPSAAEVLEQINVLRDEQGLTALTLNGGNSIKCATSEIFNPVDNEYAVNGVDNNYVVAGAYSRINSVGQIETGKSTQFMLRMDLGDGTERCTKVTVNKTSRYRQIISQGYTACPGGYKTPIERAIINETEVK